MCILYATEKYVYVEMIDIPHLLLVGLAVCHVGPIEEFANKSEDRTGRTIETPWMRGEGGG